MKKTLLLIGSSGGLGTELSKLIMEKDYNIALHYFTNKPNIEETDNLKLFKANITEEMEVQNLISSVNESFGKIDIVINNAGVSISEISWKSNLSNWDKSVAINLTGPFLVSKHVVPLMRRAEWGRIIFISSVVAQTGFFGTTAYAASKAGLLGLTKSLAKELAPKGITVNTIALGYFNKGMINDVPELMKDVIIDSIPKKRLGDATEIMETINYILSENSDYLTGQTINLNGGLHM